MIYKSIVIGMWLTLSLSTHIRGQASMTPFSSFGVGRHYGSVMAHNQAMGGMGISVPYHLHFNALNPALLVFNKFTVLEAGLVGEQRRLSNSNISEQSGGVNLNYLAWGFPIKPGIWTTGIGVSPYTYAHHKLNHTAKIENHTSSVEIEESKKGGINELYWSHGVTINKNLSIGLKASYFFGSIVNEYLTYLINTDQPVQYKANIFERQSFSGFGATTGIHFHLDSLLGKKQYQFNIGIVYNTEKRLNTILYKRFEQQNIVSVIDSMTLIDNTLGTTIYPQSIAGGISFSKRAQWLVGLDFTYNISSQFRDFYGASYSTNNSWKIALGGKVTPKKISIESSYFKHIIYQMGFSFERLPYELNKNAVNDLGINIGLSLPIGRISSITLVAEIGKQGNINTNMIEENYFKLYCGVTFNDQWFIRRKFD